ASGLKTTAKVGSYRPNAYGLYDMAGNVWEYTVDAWRSYRDGPAPEDLSGRKYLGVTTRRVIRGGSFAGAPVNMRVAYRDSHPPNGSREFVGFRCAK
ncbi:MAG: SUMF1/EgtB/PvdO family nonheme iron enzyme, partial [Acidobacteria bacterium]|nr:SUMF1/EgtB/PvdO family nonheme iron enzyme [Acidobacteriota bacterium]